MYAYAISFLLICAAIRSSVAQDVTLKMLVDAEKKCLVKFPSVTKENIEELKRTKTVPADASEDFKCLLDCVGREVNVIDEQNNYHFERLKKLTVEITGGSVSYDQAHEKVTKCMEENHPLPCEKAFKYVTCKAEMLKDAQFHKDFCETCDL